MKLRRKVFVGIFAFASLYLSQAVSAKEAIRIGIPSWPAGEIIAHNIAEKIEAAGLKYEVSFVDLTDLDHWSELDKDDGAIDIFPDIWMPNHQPNWDQYVIEAASVEANRTPYIATQGFHVYSPDIAEFNELSIDDLSDPKVIDYFDSDGNGKAEFWPGGASYRSKHYSKLKLHEQGLSDKWESLEIEQDEFLAALEQRKRIERPILFYYWTPEWLFAKYTTFQLTEPDYQDGCMVIEGELGEEGWMENSTFNCNYPETQVYMLYRDGLDVELQKVLNKYFVSTEKLEAALLEQLENKLDAKVVASLLNK